MYIQRAYIQRCICKKCNLPFKSAAHFSYPTDNRVATNFATQLTVNVLPKFDGEYRSETSHRYSFQYASKEQDGIKFMTYSDFIRRYLGLLTEKDAIEETVFLLGNIVDTTNNGYVR